MSILLRGLALILIGEAAFRAASTHVEPGLDSLTDPKYLGATTHFWEFVFIGAIVFLIGWSLKRNPRENQQA
jgi:hypothetical protein